MFSEKKHFITHCFVLLLTIIPNVYGEYIKSSEQILETSQSKKYNVEHLILYRVIRDMRTIVEESIVLNPKFLLSTNKEIIEKIEQALSLCKSIIADFNKSEELIYNQRIKYGFINICNYLSSFSAIKPRHLRELRAKIEQYNTRLVNEIEVFNSYAIKNRLGENSPVVTLNISLFNKISLFNYVLLEELLFEKLLEISVVDKVLDRAIYQPTRWAYDNSEIVLIAGTLFFGIGIYFAYKHWGTKK